MTTDEKEHHWLRGNRAAYRAILIKAASHLDDERIPGPGDEFPIEIEPPE
jgi:hypothetical protein